jgi:hypothetical protein
VQVLSTLMMKFLGRDNRKLHSTIGRISSKEPLMLTTHKVSFPTCLSHPRSVHLHCHTVHRLLHLPFQGFNNRPTHEFLELCSCHQTPSRRNHFLNTLSHLERVAHRPENLLLLSTGLTTHFFIPTPQPMSMVMAATKTGHGGW